MAAIYSSKIYSESIHEEFGEVIRRKNSGHMMRLRIYVPSGATYTVMGQINGVVSSHLSLKNPKVKGLETLASEGLVQKVTSFSTNNKNEMLIPLGPMIATYEFLSKPYYDASEEIQAYRKKVEAIKSFYKPIASRTTLSPQPVLSN